VREPSRVTPDAWEKALNLRSSSLMKGIQPYHVCSLALLFAGCTSGGERAVIHADGEIFEAVARSQLTDTVEPGVSSTALRFDSRPAGDNIDLAGSPERPRQLDLGEAADSLSTGAQEDIVEQRKDILKSLRIEEGGPFNYPECGGTRTRRQRDSSTTLPAPRCPRAVRRYVTVGLPFAGAAQLLEKVRPPEVSVPDSTGEMWTVLVSESTVGPGGQQWRQYVTLFRRDPVGGRLAVAERYLLSWAE
jgi:hypothetical protein